MAQQWDVPGYTGVKALGSGGFGEVVLARHDASGTRVAIKYLRAELLADPEFAAMFRAEAAVLASLDDANVVRLYEYVESPSGAAIVMELIDGVSLRDILARQGQTTAEAALVVLQGSLLGLAAAHRRGVVHRDYKPENVLIDGAGASKLTDFGIAARAGDSPIPAGTLAYAPPEQFGGGPATPAGDVYAATATFYECLTGRPPFSGDSAERLLYQHLAEPVPLEPVPAPLRPLVTAGLAKDPGGRPADGTALVAELRAVAGSAYGPGWEDRGRSGLAAAALLLAALWPTGGPPAIQGTAVHRVRLLRRLIHGHSAAVKAAAIAVVGVAAAATVIVARPTGHATPAPTATSARATTQAPAPAQWTGTQLASALLPISDFPAGYGTFYYGNSGVGVASGGDILYPARCGHGPSTGLITAVGGFFDPQLDSAYAEDSYIKYQATGGSLFLSQVVYQFSSPAAAVVFFSSARTCLIDDHAWSNDSALTTHVNNHVNTALVNGDKAVTADDSTVSNGASTASEILFVLHGTDVFGLSADSHMSASIVNTLSIPGADELIAKLIARVDALGSGPSAGSSPVASPGSSAAVSPAQPARQRAAQALSALLAQSGTDRAAITQAFDAVAACSPDLSQDETIFNTAASSRQELLGKLAALTDRSALPASMLQDLTMAWQVSGEADQDFARWTQDEISHGCSTDYQADANYQDATVPDNQATTYKQAFVALWTPIADEYGLPLYRYNQI